MVWSRDIVLSVVISHFSGTLCWLFDGGCPPPTFPCPQLHSEASHRNCHSKHCDPPLWLEFISPWSKLANQNASVRMWNQSWALPPPSSCLMEKRCERGHYWWPVLPEGWRSRQNWSTVHKRIEAAPKRAVKTRDSPTEQPLVPAVPRPLATCRCSHDTQDLYK